MRSSPSERSRAAYAFAGIAVVCVLLLVVAGAYRGVFTPSFDVTVQAERAGLGLESGASVTYRGVAVGRVKSIAPNPDGGVEIEAAVNESSADAIPATVTARIDSSTLFGPKTVELVAPREAGDDVLAAGAVVPATSVSPEFNGLYDQAYTLLTSVDAAKLNAALTAIAQTLDGRGDDIGSAATQVRQYVEVVNDHLPAIEADIQAGRRVVDHYGRAADDLLATADNASSISKSLVSMRPTLDTFLLSLTRSAGNAALVTREVGPPLVTTMARLRPTLDVFGRFAPMLGCTIKGLNEDRKLVELVIGNKIASVQANAQILPGQRPYRTADSLPKNVSGIGPHCYGLPLLTGSELDAPRYLFDDGTIPAWTSGEGDEVTVNLDSLFGANLFDLLGVEGSTPRKGTQR